MSKQPKIFQINEALRLIDQMPRYEFLTPTLFVGVLKNWERAQIGYLKQRLSKYGENALKISNIVAMLNNISKELNKPFKP